MSGTAGASRMSSVFGLNASPHTPIVLPFSAAEVLRILREQRRLLRGVDVFDGLQNLEVVFSSAAKRIIALTSFGKQLPP